MATTKTKYRRTSGAKHVPGAGLMDRVALVEKAHLRTDLPDYKPGDTVRVHARIKEGEKERIQIFEGTIIGKSNAGASRSFRVRKISHGVGVERVFLESSPKIAKLEVVQEGRVRRAKLYYIREREGKAARIKQDIETQAQAAAKEESAAKKASAAGPQGK